MGGRREAKPNLRLGQTGRQTWRMRRTREGSSNCRSIRKGRWEKNSQGGEYVSVLRVCGEGIGDEFK